MSSSTLETTLEVKRGPLADIFPLFDASTIQHAHEIMNARRTDHSLRNQWLWTADFPMYRAENGEAVLYFAPRENNLIFRNVQDATSQLLSTQNYVPTREGIDEVVAAANSDRALRVKLSDLRLQGNDNEWRYFEINTSNPSSLNPTERAFAERVYGQCEEFTENMRMLQEDGKTSTRIYVLNPDYVKSKVKGDSAIARASRLGRFDYDSVFYAEVGLVGGRYDGLRGVLKKSAEGAAPRKIEESPVIDYASVFEQAGLNPSEAVRHLNPKTASGLLNVLNLYYTPKQKA